MEWREYEHKGVGGDSRDCLVLKSEGHGGGPYNYSQHCALGFAYISYVAIHRLVSNAAWPQCTSILRSTYWDWEVQSPRLMFFEMILLGTTTLFSEKRKYCQFCDQTSSQALSHVAFFRGVLPMEVFRRIFDFDWIIEMHEGNALRVCHVSFFSLVVCSRSMNSFAWQTCMFFFSV